MELQGQILVTQYYYFGAQRVAMRREGLISYLVGDHPSLGTCRIAGAFVLVRLGPGTIASFRQTLDSGVQGRYCFLLGIVERHSVQGSIDLRQQ